MDNQHHQTVKIGNCSSATSGGFNYCLRSLRGDQSGGPNICPYCKKGWRTKSALEMHIRVHTGEEPFICPYCGKGHKQKGQLKVHIQKHHPQVQNAFEALSLRRDSNSSSSKFKTSTWNEYVFGSMTHSTYVNRLFPQAK